MEKDKQKQLFLLKDPTNALKKLLPVLLLFSLLSCQKQEKPRMAFYYWKTVFKLAENEKRILSQNHIDKIYLRYFDVALKNDTQEPYPVGVIRFEDTAAGYTIVPVVYIKNEVMLNPELDIEDLSAKITKLINEINSKKGIPIQEIQIDCDWTMGSRDAYLKFIDVFKKSNKTLLSATIRLHQVKYFNRTKIPNADKGVLMYYNMGKIDTDTLNSIYDRKIASRYVNSLENYPLPLNVALPVFSCGIHIRNGNVIGLKSKISEAELEKDINFVKVRKHFFRAANSNYKRGIYYRKNDLLKVESVSDENLLEMATDLNEHLKQQPKEIILYDLDALNLNNYGKGIFEKISDCF